MDLVLDPRRVLWKVEGGLGSPVERRSCITHWVMIFSGSRSLKINVESLLPNHFDGVLEWSDAQQECLTAYYRRNTAGWVKDILGEVPLTGIHIHEATLGVVKRRCQSVADYCSS